MCRGMTGRMPEKRRADRLLWNFALLCADLRLEWQAAEVSAVTSGAQVLALSASWAATPLPGSSTQQL